MAMFPNCIITFSISHIDQYNWYVDESWLWERYCCVRHRWLIGLLGWTAVILAFLFLSATQSNYVNSMFTFCKNLHRSSREYICFNIVFHILIQDLIMEAKNKDRNNQNAIIMEYPEQDSMKHIDTWWTERQFLLHTPSHPPTAFPLPLPRPLRPEPTNITPETTNITPETAKRSECRPKVH